MAFLNQDRSSKKSEGKSAYEDLFGRPRTVTFSGIPRPRSHALSSCMPPRACVWCVVCGVWCVVHTVCRSLSFCDPGLLNAIDGIASQEGRLFVMTTNHMEHLDPGMASSDFPAEWPSDSPDTHDTRHGPTALIRPGRVDKVVHFGLASMLQVERMFLRCVPLAPRPHRALLVTGPCVRFDQVLPGRGSAGPTVCETGGRGQGQHGHAPGTHIARHATRHTPHPHTPHRTRTRHDTHR